LHHWEEVGYLCVRDDYFEFHCICY